MHFRFPPQLRRFVIGDTQSIKVDQPRIRYNQRNRNSEANLDFVRGLNIHGTLEPRCAIEYTFLTCFNGYELFPPQDCGILVMRLPLLSGAARMVHHRSASWLKSLCCRRQPTIQRQSPRARRHRLTQFEDRVVPSTSIPLNATTWTPIGPSPISVGQAPGLPSSTGRINGIAVDPTDTNVMYVAADTGGIWSTTNGGATWSPRTDQSQLDFQTIAMVHRSGGNTVYAFDQQGNLWTSTDGAMKFTETMTHSRPARRSIN